MTVSTVDFDLPAYVTFPNPTTPTAVALLI